MSLGISTFHFTRWVALRFAELKSNHRIKVDISDTLGKEQWRQVLSNRSDQDTFCKEKYMGSKMKLGPLEKWKIYKFKIPSLTTVLVRGGRTSSPIISCYFLNLRLWKKLNNESAIKLKGNCLRKEKKHLQSYMIWRSVMWILAKKFHSLLEPGVPSSIWWRIFKCIIKMTWRSTHPCLSVINQD